MKSSCYLAVALLLFGLVPVKQPVQKQQYHSHRDKNRTQYVGYSGIPPMIAIENPHSTPVKRCANQDSNDGWDSPIWPNWALVFVGIIASIVGIYTVKATKQAADAARDSAEAGQSQINAQIAAIRPWLIIKKIEDPYLIPLSEVPVSERKFPYCIITFENSGRTPARIVASQVEMWIGDRVDMPPLGFKLQPSSDVSEGDSYLFPAGSTRQTDAKLNPTGVISPEERDSITVSKVQFLWLCGMIRYRDTFTRPNTQDYETRFCYRYEARLNTPKPIWMIAGPPEYNRTT